MPRYFFHVQNDQALPDNEGTELPDLLAARVNAVKLAGEILKHHAETFWTEGEWSLKVTDESGLTLFTLYFLAVEAPITRRSQRQS
ncbi:hypothetical protein J8J14_18120 [Roseomonas sp. SSH11]|uniref:DUF6894 domain-containing protein n=1 Tax=Pararoseomonas baculiformis TaxID=2820812 RepID=A0ABS4AIK4_9PROT|nr:hypothetical protein [Pararoseomonas baculiformis]MBP0446696.1 hypothetical protein [Pararoseomonas baculiformis]